MRIKGRSWPYLRRLVGVIIDAQLSDHKCCFAFYYMAAHLWGECAFCQYGGGVSQHLRRNRFTEGVGHKRHTEIFNWDFFLFNLTFFYTVVALELFGTLLFEHFVVYHLKKNLGLFLLFDLGIYAHLCTYSALQFIFEFRGLCMLTAIFACKVIRIGLYL